MQRSIALPITISAVTLTVAAIPATVDVEIPEEWHGIWSLELNSYDCDTNALLFSSTAQDTICAGSVFVDPDPSSIDVTCEASIDGTTYTITCEGDLEVTPGCFSNFTYDATATLSGETYTSVATSNTTYTGDCPVIPDSCQRTEITGTRLGPAPDPCGSTPVDSVSWSAVKGLYR